MSDLVISVHTSDQKVRKFATKEPKLLKNYIGLKKVHYRRFSPYSMFSVGLYEDCRPFDDNYSLQVGCETQRLGDPFILF